MKKMLPLSLSLVSALLPMSGVVLAQTPVSRSSNPANAAGNAAPATPLPAPGAPAPIPDSVAHSTLPVRQVTLYTSGVAYTERSGMVSGDASVPLLFRTAQINDILKSLVLIDQKGQVRPATYASRDPVGHALQAFAVDVTQNLSQEEVLGRMRGGKVSVEIPGKPAVVGQIVGVEQRQMGGDDNKPISASYLNLLTDTGLTSIRLDGEKTVRILDERLNKEFHDALSVLASGSDEQRRQVMLHFAGNGSREVHVGYVMESPIWKISYRLVIGEGGEKVGAKSYLQGWALVENTTDEDWENVRLSLVSGRPVSFIQDLYQPLYIPRPVVGPDVVASPYPQTHDENMLADRQALVEKALNPSTYNPVYSGAIGGSTDPTSKTIDLDVDSTNLYSALTLLFSKVKANFTLDESLKSIPVTLHLNQAPFRVALETLLRSTNTPLTYKVENGIYSVVPKVEEAPPTPEAAMDSPFIVNGALYQGYRQLQAQASGQKSGELFQYKIDTPVNLPRQQAAMIPVITQDIETEKVSIYNADFDGKFPMNAIRVHNTTSLHLKGGPVSLFDGGAYAGDAKMEDVPPGDSRLISYAVDMSMECERQNPTGTMIDTTFSIKRGVLTIRRREQIETDYTLKSKTDTPRTVLLEHPFNSQYQLVTPEKPTERTSSVYRFAITVAPRKSQSFKVVTEVPETETFAILDGKMESLVAYSNHKLLSPKLKAELLEVIQRRKHVDELKDSAEARAKEVTSISDDQERIRKNMEALDKSSALYKRYVSELDTQETKIENLRQEAVRLRGQVETTTRDLNTYVDTLTE